MTPKPLITAPLLFISAYSPLFLILIVKDFNHEKTCWLNHPWVALFLIILVVLSNVFLYISIRSVDKGNNMVEVISTKNRSLDLINYTIPYIIPFVGVNLSTLGDIFSLIVFLLMMMLLTIKSQTVFMNPVFLILGYNLYDMEYLSSSKGEKKNTIVLSKQLKTGDKCYIIGMSDFLYFVKEVKK